MNTFNNIQDGKSELRRKMRARLAEITPQQREAWSRCIIEWLTAAGSCLEKAGVVALFGGIKTEPDLSALLPWLGERGRQVAFFALGEEGVMHPHLVRDAGSLVAGPFGVLMPDVSKCPRVDEAELSVVLVPGLAFSVRNGARLGRGKGYYDRVLGGLGKDARIIGVGFSMQMTDFIPREPHDVCVHSLLCEDGWQCIGASKDPL